MHLQIRTLEPVNSWDINLEDCRAALDWKGMSSQRMEKACSDTRSCICIIQEVIFSFAQDTGFAGAGLCK